MFDYHAAIHSKNLSSSSLSLQFSTQCLAFLKETLLTASAVGHELVYELTPLQGDSSEAFQQLFVGAVQDELLSISLSRNIASNECGRHISQVYSLLSMMNPSTQMKDLDLDGMFSDLIEAAKGKTILPGLINKLWVYSCLLGRSNNYLATRFCEVEDHLWSSQRLFPPGQSGRTAELQASLDVPTSVEEIAVWKELFHQAVFDGYHILEHIIVSDVHLQVLFAHIVYIMITGDWCEFSSQRKVCRIDRALGKRGIWSTASIPPSSRVVTLPYS